MNLVDKAISFFNPEAGLRRQTARLLLLNADRKYAAAADRASKRNPRIRSTSANREIGRAMRKVADRARKFARDSWAGQRILDVMTSHIIGAGISMVPNTGSDKLDNVIKDIIAEWSERSDVEGVLDWPGQQALMVRSMIEGGDSVLRHVDLSMSEADGSVPFRLQGLEGDQIDSNKDRAGAIDTGTNARLGVELGEYGRRRGLWLLSEHPGEMTTARFESSMLPWENLCHLYRPLRFGQVRGISWFAPILVNGDEAQDLMDATLIKSRVEASFAAFLTRPPAGASPFAGQQDENSGKLVTRIEPGMVVDVGEGDVKFANPSSQTAVAEVNMITMRAMAAGAGITYDQLTGDLRQANYSSLRAGKIEFRRLVEQVQWTTVVPMMIAPVGRKLINRAILSGKLRERKAGYRLDYVMPAIEPIDPLKDLQADILAVKSGRLSPQEFISAWGRDWRDVVSDTASFWEFFDRQKGNVGIDIDGRNNRKGQSNGKP